MKYERLTKRDGVGRFVNDDCIDCAYHKDNIMGCDFCCGDKDSKHWCCGIMYDRLAELEDKIENGTLIELPCKVGDIVWELDLFSKAKIREIKAQNLLQIFHWIDDESFGKFLFLTKAEAEAKLKELKRK